MFYVIEAAKGSAETQIAPLSAAEALQKMTEAEALGMGATCTDANGNTVSRQHLLEAAGRAQGT